MKKIAILILSILIAGLFVACNQDITVDAQTYANMEVGTFVLNGQNYATLQEAVNAKLGKSAKAVGDNDGVIYLTRNASGPGAVINSAVTGGVTIDFAGYTYSFTNVTGLQGGEAPKPESFGLAVTNGAQVTLKGMEKIDLNDKSTSALTMVYIEGAETKLSIESAPKMVVEPEQYVFWAANGASLTIGGKNATESATVTGKVAATGGATKESKPTITVQGNTELAGGVEATSANVKVTDTASITGSLEAAQTTTVVVESSAKIEASVKATETSEVVISSTEKSTITNLDKESTATVTVAGGEVQVDEIAVGSDPEINTAGDATISGDAASKVEPIVDDSEAIIEGTLYTYFCKESDQEHSAYHNAKSGDTIKLLKDINLTNTLETSKSFDLDLNGKNICATDCRALFIYEGTISIVGEGTISATGTSLNSSSSVIRLGSPTSVSNAAKLTIGADVTVNSDKSYGVTVFGYNVNASSVGQELVVYGTVTVTGESAAISGNGSTGLSKTKITINEGAVVSSTGVDTGGAGPAAIYHPQGGTLTVNGGTITGSVTGIEAEAGSVVIKGGEINTTYSGNPGVKPGTEDGPATHGYSVVAVKRNYPAGPANVSITGGTIKGTVGVVSFNGGTDNAVLGITGGIFDLNPSAYVVYGYKAVDNGDGTWTVAPITDGVAAITRGTETWQFVTLQDAVDAAQNGDTITLLKEVTLGSQRVTFNGGKTIILDLAGYPLFCGTDSHSFDISGANLTVQNGTINGNDKQVFNVYGRTENGEGNYSVLTIAANAEIVNAGYGICVFPASGTAGYDTEVNLNGSITGRHGIFVSGNLANTDSEASNEMIASNVINLGNGSSIRTTDQAIAMNGGATVNVADGATLIGSEAIGLKRGTLNVTGGTLRATGEYAVPTANNNGTEASGAVVSITSTYNYARGIVAIITGGTFESANGHALSIQKTDIAFSEEALEVTVSGGTFTAGSNENAKAVYAADGTATKFIVGGKYSSDPTAYVADGYEAVLHTDGKYYVRQIPKEVRITITEQEPIETSLVSAAKMYNGLQNIPSSPSDLTIEILSDADLKDIVWAPIGSRAKPFVGKVYGAEYTIKNLNIAKPDDEGVGLFGYLKNSEIKDVILEKASITAAGDVGFLAGGVFENNIIDGFYVDENSTIIAKDCIGGVFGIDREEELGNKTIIKNTTVAGNLSGSFSAGDTCRVGGFVGSDKGMSNIVFDSCIFEGTASGKWVGGFIAHDQMSNYVEPHIFINCSSNGSLETIGTDSDKYYGSFFGNVYYAMTFYAKNCTVNGKNLSSYAHGDGEIVGHLLGTDGTTAVTYCIGNDNEYVSGFDSTTNQIGGFVGSFRFEVDENYAITLTVIGDDCKLISGGRTIYLNTATIVGTTGAKLYATYENAGNNKSFIIEGSNCNFRDSEGNPINEIRSGYWDVTGTIPYGNPEDNHLVFNWDSSNNTWKLDEKYQSRYSK